MALVAVALVLSPPLKEPIELQEQSGDKRIPLVSLSASEAYSLARALTRAADQLSGDGPG